MEKKGRGGSSTVSPCVEIGAALGAPRGGVKMGPNGGGLVLIGVGAALGAAT
jgi:hypothetical protein